MNRQHRLFAAIASLTMLIGVAHAEPIKAVRTITGVDVTTAGISAIDNGTGSILLSGVNGQVKRAFLYWHGINNAGAYNRPTITFKNASVTGQSLGVSGTNCWGAGQSTAYEADVTSLVTGNGSYSLSGLAMGGSEHANGASLVVLYNDNDSTNNRGVVFYTGNDSTHDAAHLGDPDGWQASLPGVKYSANGDIKAILHVADGQNAPDMPLTFSTESGSVTFPDTAQLYDGNSLPSGGSARHGHGLYDVHTFNIKPAFGNASGSKTLSINATPGGDCLALVAMQLSFNPPTMAPDVGGGNGPFTTCKASGITHTAKLAMCQMICERRQTTQTLTMLIKAYVATWKEDPPCSI